MPSASARRVYEDQIPTFTSVFGLDAETMEDRDTITVVDPRMVQVDAKQATMNVSQPLGHGVSTDPNHKHNDSTSTQMSESADSSPTTTLSTTDSSPLTDPSPSSSPDSPVGLVPLNNFPATSFGSQATNMKLAPAPTPVENGLEVGSLQRPMTSPAPRKRNMKGLSIQPPSVAPAASSNVTSEPASPVFIKPKIPGMKRKPSMLSLKTDTSGLMGKPIAEVPPSPGMAPILQRRALKHSTSSPHMLSTIKSATFGPAGGMTLPNMLERNESGLSEVLRPMKTSMNMSFDTTITEEPSAHIRSQMASRMDAEPYHEKVNNEDQKTPGYPDGPIAIYDDDVFLYLEPTAEEASKFDLVINVAKEVVNPFEAQKAKLQSPTMQSPVPDTALTNASFATAFEFQPGSETPTTPKANPFKMPEYIHMPWDHNTDIAPDLMQLCELIDQRTKSGKKVLIHCQQGASRSASLIIAYGLYRRPDLTVNDAYYAAQAKSQWISPNMKLMYSLQDFQKDVSKRRLSPASGLRNGRSPTKHRLTLSADAIGMPPKEPRTAPLPGEEDEKSEGGFLRPAESHRRGNSMPSPQGISPGPQSAPPNFSWREEVEKATDELPKPTHVAELPERPKPDSILTQAAEPPRQSFSYEPPPTPGFNGPNGGLAFNNKAFPRFSNQARLSQHHIQFEAPVAFAPPTRAPPPPPPPAASTEPKVSIEPAYPDDDDAMLMSPRAETMAHNPLRDFSHLNGMHFQETPPTPDQDLFSPRQTMFPRDPMAPFGRPDQVADPRSPPTKGETPIVRSIDDIL